MKNSKQWKKFKRNKPAMAGGCIILLAIVLAAFAYGIIPDSSPDANFQQLAINKQAPGFSIQTIRLKKSTQENKTNFIQQLINGAEPDYLQLPVLSFQNISDNNIQIVKYTGIEGLRDTIVINKSAIHSSCFKNNQVQTVSKTYLLGTDKYGRDVLSRIILGTRVSLSVGIIAVLISVLIGVIVGAMAGFFGGLIDEALMWLVNVIWAIPTLLLVFALSIALGRGFWQVFIAVGLTMWVQVARVIRGQVLSIGKQEFIEAARSLGYSNVRIIVRHIIPNTIGALTVIAASNFATAILVEAGLSFLGIGVQPPSPSWGLMIKENYHLIITGNPLPAFIPGIAIMLLVLAFNWIGSGLRDAFDVKGK